MFSVTPYTGNFISLPPPFERLIDKQPVKTFSLFTTQLRLLIPLPLHDRALYSSTLTIRPAICANATTVQQHTRKVTVTNNFSLFYIFVIIYLVSLNLFFLFGLSIGFYIEYHIATRCFRESVFAQKLRG